MKERLIIYEAVEKQVILKEKPHFATKHCCFFKKNQQKYLKNPSFSTPSIYNGLQGVPISYYLTFI